MESIAQADLPRKIFLAAAAILVLMILFPPKAVTKRNPLFDQSVSQSAGYQFILSNPAAEEAAAAKILLGDEVDKYIYSRIEWGKLLMQFVVVGVAAFVALRIFGNGPRRSSGAFSG